MVKRNNSQSDLCHGHISVLEQQISEANTAYCLQTNYTSFKNGKISSKQALPKN